jgi:hypothetical protein
MNKTIFQIDYKLSVMIISILGIIVGFISNGYGINGLGGLFMHLIKILMFVGIYLVFYLIENKNTTFKEKLKYMLGNIMIANAINFTFAIFSLTHILPYLFLTLSGIVSLYIIVSFIFEILSLYVDNKLINKLITVNKKIGNAIAEPITSFFDKKFTND